MRSEDAVVMMSVVVALPDVLVSFAGDVSLVLSSSSSSSSLITNRRWRRRRNFWDIFLLSSSPLSLERIGNDVAMVVFVIAIVDVVVAMLTKYTRLAIIVHDRSVVVSTINLTIFVLTDALVYG